MPSRNFTAPWPKTPGRLLGTGLVRLYQLTLSGFIGNSCRHFPTCSEFAYEAIARHGLWRGGFMGLFRVIALRAGWYAMASIWCPTGWTPTRHGGHPGGCGASAASRRPPEAKTIGRRRALHGSHFSPIFRTQPFPRALNPRRTEQDMGRFAVLSMTDAAAARVPGDRREPGGVGAAFASASRRVDAPGWSIPSTLVTEPDAKGRSCRASGRPCMGRAGSSPFPCSAPEMDFEVTTLRTGFVFKNPNQSSACGCGESVELKPADLKELAEARAGAA